MNCRHEMQKTFLPFCFAVCLVAASGCGTLRGTPPSFNETPGNVGLVAPPKPPVHRNTDDLMRKIVDPPDLNSLTQIDALPHDPKIIFYPRPDLQTEEDVVQTEAIAEGEVTYRNKDAIKKEKDSFLAIIDLKNESARAAASGRLAADFLYRAVVRESADRDNPIRILDNEEALREVTDALGGEVDPDKNGIYEMSPDHIFKVVGSLKYPSFWLSGAVTSFSSENKELEFQYVVKEDSDGYQRFLREVENWRKDYREYVLWYRDTYEPAYKAYLREFQERQGEQAMLYRNYERSYKAYTDTYNYRYSPQYQRYVSKLKNQATLSNILFLPLHLGLEIITFGGADTWTRARPARKRVQQPKKREPSIGRPVPKTPPLDLRTRIPSKCDPDSIMAVMRQRGVIPPPVRRMATVCNVGVTLRLVGGISADQGNYTAEILWIGNGSVRDVDLQSGMKNVCDKLAGKIVPVILKGE